MPSFSKAVFVLEVGRLADKSFSKMKSCDKLMEGTTQECGRRGVPSFWSSKLQAFGTLALMIPIIGPFLFYPSYSCRTVHSCHQTDEVSSNLPGA